jgi:hypothetical protein
LRHRKKGEEEQAEELMGILFGAIGAFFSRSRPQKDRQTISAPAPEQVPDPDAEERSRIAAEFERQVDPEAPGDNTTTRAIDNRIKVLVPGARQR